MFSFDEANVKNNEKSKFKNQKRILMILSTIGINGGVQNKVMDIYRNINRDKVQFDFFVYAKVPVSFEEEIIGLGGKVIYPGRLREVGIYSFFKTLYRVMKSENYYAIHSHTGYNSGPIMLLASFAGIENRIVHSRGTNIANPKMRKLLPILKYLIDKYATKLLACSKQAGDFLYKNSEFEVIHNALDINRFVHIDQILIDELRKDMQIDIDMIVLGHVGRFSKEKNHQFLISIARELKNKNIKFKLIFVGDGELKPQIEGLTKELKLEENICFVGAQAEIEKYYHIFDILLFPSFYEGFGNVAVEAQLARNKVIASNGVSREVDMGLNLVTFLELNDINNWIDEITKYDRTVKEISTKSIINALVAKGFNIDNVVKKYYQIYNIR